jgi:hypothetical protein
MERMKIHRRSFLGALAGPAILAQRTDYDVLVWDSTPAGIMAAIAAAGERRHVALVTEDKHVGGMQTSGLGNTNAGQRETIGGMARDFHRRVHGYYVRKYGAGSEQVKVSKDGFFFEPHVAEEVFLDWLREAGVECLTEQRLAAVEKQDDCIVSIRTHAGRTLRAAVFIDAGYEGDLLKMAGCSYALGRESSAEYGESLAGVRFPPSRLGQADRKLQAFDYRLCLTDDNANRVPFRRPDTYRASNYAWMAARIRHGPPGRLQSLLPFNPVPNRKTDSRTGEWVGASWDYAEAGAEERRRIEQAHRDYSAGYLWFLLTDEAVPEPFRAELSRWGLAKDEFRDNGHWPYHIYVREARRLRGDFVMTQQDIERRYQSDSIGLGSFFLDVHPVEIVVAGDMIVAEGNLGNPPVKPYEIPYRALLPKRREARNLLAPVCLSASHVAFSSIRMEPVWSMLGQAAGVAASQSLESGGSAHAVQASRLQARLLEQGAILSARPFDQFWPQSSRTAP